MLCKEFSPHVGKSKIDLDSGFHAEDFGLQVLNSGFFFEWNLDSGFQSLMGFQIPWAVFPVYCRFQSPGFQISQAKFPAFRNLNSLTRGVGGMGVGVGSE